MPSCVECGSFSRYKGGWCDHHDRETRPSDWCPQHDNNASEPEGDPKTCSSCDSFDPYTRGGWCNHHKCTTNASAYCPSWS